MLGGRFSSGASTSADNDPLRERQKKDTNEDVSDATASASESGDSHSVPLPMGEYEVFLNFRGPDTRYNITDILYWFLVNLKIRTFKDDDDLRKGEGIWPNLVEAIQQSKIYVPIFSVNYADSKWCLRELAEIVKRQERNQGCIILPIFYMVDPRDVRHQNGLYHNAFEEYQKLFDGETIQVWKDALNKVGELKGWHIKSNTEQVAIADLVTGVILSHLSKNNITLETDKLIGIDGHIKAVKSRMTLDSPSMTIVGIHGMGGIGKTTIAKAVYNQVSAQFDRCSFVENVREMLQQKNGVSILQRHIISDILRENYDGSITNDSEGINIIRDRISRFKFLIVLDDVDEKFEFDKILGHIKNFVLESRFIITSRNIKVLRNLTYCKLYRVREMSHHHSLQLFCNHAFRKDSPPSSYENLSKDIVSVAAGLPLTLKVVGSLLFDEKKEIWEDKLLLLKEIPEEGVMERLKISYDTLTEEAKQIFLDIACFFIGEEKELPSYMWSDCRFFPITNINILIQKSMIEFVPSYGYRKMKLFGIHISSYRDRKKNLFGMHDQLRDMGREIIRKENTKCSWKRSRIWSTDEALGLLQNKKGTGKVTGIRIHYSHRNEFRKLWDDRRHDHDYIEFCYNNGYMEFAKKKFKGIGNESFTKLQQLRYLDINTSPMLPIDDLENYVPNLRWLRFHNGVCIPNFSMETLLILELFISGSGGSEALSHIEMASKLKVLKLSFSPGIKFPQLPRFGNLEILDVEGCSNGWNLDIENLGNLKVLRLQNCAVREISYGTVGMVPLENIRVWHLLPSSLTTLHIKDCPYLKWLPNLGNLDNLTDLCVTNCPSLKEIVGIGGLKSLETLSIYGLEAVCNLDGLDKLYSLIYFSLSQCGALETLPTMASLSKLIQLEISKCPRLTEIQGLGGLKSLETLKLHNLALPRNVDGLDSLCSLKSLNLGYCSGLETLPTMASLEKLLNLEISSCLSLAEIRGLEGLKSLQVLRIFGSPRLTRLLGLETLLAFNRLKTLRIISCCLDTSIPFHDLDDGLLSEATVVNSLREIHLRGTALVLQNFYRMIQLFKFPSLTKLTLIRARKMGNADIELRLDGLVFMEALVELRLSGLICKLPSLSKLGNLKLLMVSNNPKLQKIEGLAGLKSLEELDLVGCTALERLPADELYGLERLKWVNIKGCTNLIDLSALRKLESRVKILWPDSGDLERLNFYDSVSSNFLLEVRESSSGT